MKTSARAIAIRADAAPRIGTGHIMRCLTLADALAARGRTVSFLSRELPRHLETTIAAHGHRVVRLDAGRDDADATRAALMTPPPVDWLIVDHYGLDARWEKAVRPAAARLMVLDDLADRPHDCDLLLDAGFGEDGSRYRDLLPAGCRGLYGSSFVLLRPQFAEARLRGPARSDAGEPVAHVFFGGSDRKALTTRFARALARRLPRLRQAIVVGELYPDVEGLIGLQRDFPGRIAWTREVADMAAHMSRCSFAVGAPGMATWERACLGLPAVYVATHPNQRPLLETLAKEGFCGFLGDADLVTDDEFGAGVEAFLTGAEGMARMRDLGMRAIDGLGAARAAEALDAR